MNRSQSIGENGTGTTCTNRGIDNRNIFNDESDYEQFMAIMGHYLIEYHPEHKTGFKDEKKYLVEKKKRRNLAKEVKLLAFCLLPNQFELLLIGEITKFIRRVCTTYSMYYNKKYKRHGTIFEGRYKMEKIEKSQILTNIDKIHQSPNTRVVRRFGPIETSNGFDASNYRYSSVVPRPWITKYE